MASARAPSDRQVALAFKALAEEHAGKRLASDSRQAWQRVVLAGRASRSPGRRPRWLAAFALLSTLVVASALLLVARDGGEALRFEVSGASLTDGLIRSGDGRATVTFSDASLIRAEPDTTFGVEVVGRRAALTRLERGKLRVAVQHDEDTDYRFFAGPYEVRVVGTAFELSFQPADGFRLRMLEGRVRLVGPGGLDRALAAGESVHWRESGAESDPPGGSAPGTDGSGPAASGSAPALSAVSAAPALSDEHARPARPAAPQPEPSWEEELAKGRFDAVVHAAEQVGIEAVLRTRGASELRALANAARYTGKSELSRRAWSAIRVRFAREVAGQQASFFLGRLHDEGGQSAKALGHFDSYLAEAPKGTYAAEALGRRLALIQRLRGKAQAKAAASEYLARYPKGAYAAAARTIVDGD